MLAIVPNSGRERAYNVAGVTVVKKYDEQSAAPCLVGKADAMTALRPVRCIRARSTRLQYRKATHTIILDTCCRGGGSSDSGGQEEKINQNGIHGRSRVKDSEKLQAQRCEMASAENK